MPVVCYSTIPKPCHEFFEFRSGWDLAMAQQCSPDDDELSQKHCCRITQAPVTTIFIGGKNEASNLRLVMLTVVNYYGG